MTEPDTYWKLMPSKRADTFRHLPLEHVGGQNEVNEAAIIRAHDRSVPLRYNTAVN